MKKYKEFASDQKRNNVEEVSVFKKIVTSEKYNFVNEQTNSVAQTL